jgi:hypothetical protein
MNVYAYKQGSESARLLAKALACKMIKHEGSVFKGERDKVVVNWGASSLPEEVKKCTVLNKGKNVAKIVDKKALYTLIGNKWDVPLHTTDVNEAQNWLDGGLKLLIEPNGTYIHDVNYDGEFRLHFVGGKQIKAQQKKGNAEELPTPTREMITRSCRELMAFLGLDLGAITVGYVKATGRFYITAVNTAPKIDEGLAVRYANNISLLVKGQL